MKLKEMVTRHPMFFGALIGLLIFGTIVITETWFPWIDEALRGHKRLAQAVLFTAIYFVTYIYGLRRWRQRSVFWPSICVLFLLHVLGVFLYTIRVQPILVWQWPIVGLLEYYTAAFFLHWTTQHLGQNR